MGAARAGEGPRAAARSKRAPRVALPRGRFARDCVDGGCQVAMVATLVSAPKNPLLFRPGFVMGRLAAMDLLGGFL